jgi:ABC-type antimicrobial peptide transport system permease subunit
MALVIASVGIYGIISHSLGRRTGEISIRMALGARATNVHALVLREVLAPAALGLVAGLVASTLVGRAIGGLLFEVQPTDAATFLAVAAILAAVAAVAAWVPARRATRIDPVEALRAG